MRDEAVDTALGKVFAAGFALVMVAIAVVIELRTSLEELENERVRSTAHLAIDPNADA